MIKLRELQNQGRLTREVTVPFIYRDDNGVEQTTEMRVRYWSFSIAETREYQSKLEAMQRGDLSSTLADILALLIAELPDVVDDNGNPVQVTPELLSQINIVNLRAIDRAISEDLYPK